MNAYFNNEEKPKIRKSQIEPKSQLPKFTMF